MPDTPSRVPLPPRSGAEEAFPTLTADQMARIAPSGKAQRVEPGEVLLRAEAGGA
jgi:hypothetical protein